MGLVCLLILFILICPFNEKKIFFNASALVNFEDIKENVAIALYDFDAQILDFDNVPNRKYFPKEYKSFIHFKKDDFFHVLDEFHEDFWWAESLITKAKGVVPSFLVKYLKEDTKNKTTMDSNKEISIIRAMQDFDSMNLTGFLSYKKEESFKIVKPMDSLGTIMLLVRSEETGKQGIVARRKTYLFNATALYDFDAEILKVQSLYLKDTKFRKGDYFYVIQNIKIIELDGWLVDGWLVKHYSNSLVNIYPKPLLEVHSNSTVPIFQENIEFKNFSVVLMQSIDETLTGFLSYMEGERIQMIIQYSADLFFSRSLTTDKEGFFFYPPDHVALEVVKALYDFDSSILGLEEIAKNRINFKKEDKVYVKFGKANGERTQKVRVKSTKLEGFVPTFFFYNKSLDLENSLDFQHLNMNKNRTVAITNFDSSNLESFISYEYMEELEIIEMNDLQFWKAKKVSTGECGIIDRNKIAIGKAVALFDYTSTQDDNRTFTIRRGETYFLLTKIDENYWLSISDSKKGPIPELVLLFVPFSFDQRINVKNFSSSVSILHDFDGNDFPGFLSFRVGETINIVKKFNNHTWLAFSIRTNKVGLIPTFLVENPSKTFGDTLPALRDTNKRKILRFATEFLRVKRGDLLHIKKTLHPEIWLATFENQRGYILKRDVIDTCIDGFVCGDVCVPFKRIFQGGFKCQCGNGTIFPFEDSFATFCCIHPKDSCIEENKDSVICSRGNIQENHIPCHGTCHGDYKYCIFANTFTCENSNNECIHASQMCQGVDWCGETEYCNKDIQCNDLDKNTAMNYIKEGKFEFLVSKSRVHNNHHIQTNLISEHHFCKNNDLKLIGNYMYDWLDRSDEQITLFQKKINRIDFSYIHDCVVNGLPGKSCYYNEREFVCLNNWCVNNSESVSCLIGDNKTFIETNDKQLCKNNTFWKTHDCSSNIYKGVLCSGQKQHCYTPWYNFPTGDIFKFYYSHKFNCDDKSDQIFLSGVPCPHLKDFLAIHNEQYCDKIDRFVGEYKTLLSKLCYLDPVWINKHQNDSRYDDPHFCQMSCKSPGPGCEACSNENYFHCNSSEVHHCIHPELVCDGHPQCPNFEDENFEMCKGKYFESGSVNKFATVKCPCKMYPQIFTIGTACNGIEECFDGFDERFCRLSHILLIFLSISLVITLYFALRFSHWVKICSTDSDPGIILSSNTNIEDILDRYEENHDDLEVVTNTNFFLLHKKYSMTVDERKKIFSALYEREEKIHNNQINIIFQCIHRKLDPTLVTETVEIKFPGITDKIKNFLERGSGKRFITHIQDKITKQERFAKALYSLKSCYSISNEFMDFFKDAFLAINLLIVSGGFEALFEFPDNFTSVVSLLMLSSIIFALMASILHMLLYNPNLINDELTKQSVTKKVLARVIYLFGSFLNPLLIRNSIERTSEKARKCAKMGKMEETLTLFQKRNAKRRQFAEFKKIELGWYIYMFDL